MLIRLALATTLLAAAPLAAATMYTDRGIFTAALTASFNDTYEEELGYPPPFAVLTDAAMTAVAGETRYTATGFSNNNLLFNTGGGNTAYCAGCNGSFLLEFDATSLTINGGVFGAGLDILANFDSLYSALVTYGDSSTELFALPFGTFFGLTDARGVVSISFGPGGSVSQGGSFAIDNLTIGNAVPEPAAWTLMLAGFGLAGTALRSRRRDIMVS